MNVLVLPPRFTEDSIAIARAAVQCGWAVERLSSWHIPPLLAEEDVCVYAEPLFAIHACSHLEMSLIETPYDWLMHLPAEYLLRDVQSMTMGEARSTTRRRFIKSAGEKFFSPAVYESGSSLPPVGTVSDNVPVLVIEPVTWNVEFRCFVLQGNVVTGSPYLVNGELAKDKDDQWIAGTDDMAAMNYFMNRFLTDSHVRIPPAIVIDVGHIQGRGWAVVEANPAWGSGLYGCDPSDVLAAVRRACVKTKLLTEEDTDWIIDHSLENFT